MAFSQAPSSSSLSRAPTSSKASSSMASNPSLSTIEEEEEETSPTIRRILQKTGYSSRQELLALRAAQEQQASKSTMNWNRAKSSPTNPSKSATNGSKSTNASKSSTNGSKSTNPKKKSKGMSLLILDYSTFTIMSLTQFFPTIDSFEWIQIYYNYAL